jgi:hypothetical protein
VPYRGWLNTPLPLYGETMNLELRIPTQVVRRRSRFELADIAHGHCITMRELSCQERKKSFVSKIIHDSAA